MTKDEKQADTGPDARRTAPGPQAHRAGTGTEPPPCAGAWPMPAHGSDLPDVAEWTWTG
jgi:hypothetical protein